MIKGFILTAIGASVSFFVLAVTLEELARLPINGFAVFLVAPIIFGISIAVTALGVALLNKSHKKAADTNPNA